MLKEYFATLERKRNCSAESHEAEIRLGERRRVQGASPGHPLQAALNVIMNCLQTELHAPPGLWERAHNSVV